MCRCWYKFADELRQLVKGSVLGKSVVALIPLALGFMMYFPVKCIIADSRSVDCIIIVSVLGTVVLTIIILVLAACCMPEKNAEQHSNATAKAPKLPTISEDEEFAASNPIHSRSGPKQ